MSGGWWHAWMTLCVVGAVFSSWPYARDNVIRIWSGEAHVWPVSILIISALSVAAMTWITTYSYVTTPNTDAIELARERGRHAATKATVEMLARAAEDLGKELETAKSLTVKGMMPALQGEQTPIEQTEKHQPEGDFLEENLTPSQAEATEVAEDLFSGISPEALYPKGYENAKPGLEWAALSPAYENRFKPELSIREGPCLEYVIEGDGTSVATIHFRLELLDGSVSRIACVEYRFSKIAAEDTYQIIRSRLMSECVPEEIHAIGKFLYWKPETGLQVFLKPTGYYIMKRHSILPLDLEEFEKIGGGNKRQALAGELVCWKNLKYKPNKFQAEQLKVNYDLSNPLNELLINEPDILKRGDSWYCGELAFEGNQVSVENAVAYELP